MKLKGYPVIGLDGLDDGIHEVRMLATKALVLAPARILVEKDEVVAFSSMDDQVLWVKAQEYAPAQTALNR